MSDSTTEEKQTKKRGRPRKSYGRKSSSSSPNDSQPFRWITVRLKDSNTGTEILTPIVKSLLVKMSPHFAEQIELLDEGETEILSHEENIYEASAFLSELTLFYRKKEQGLKVLPVVLWNRTRAMLSTKWMVDDFVQAYSHLINIHMNKMSEAIEVSPPSSIEVTGAMGWSTDDPETATRIPRSFNGIYDKTNEVGNKGLPVYSRRGLTSFHMQWIMEYHDKSWQIKPWLCQGTRNGSCRLKCDPPVLPHLAKGVWSVADAVKTMKQPTMKVSCVETPDVLLFWEMVELVFKVVAFRFDSPIRTMEDLVHVLMKRRDLCVEEQMLKVMNTRDMYLFYKTLSEELEAKCSGMVERVRTDDDIDVDVDDDDDDVFFRLGSAPGWWRE